MPHKKISNMKPIYNNGEPNAPLQFNVKRDIEMSKRVKPQNVFDGYTRGKSKSKPSSRSKKKGCDCGCK